MSWIIVIAVLAGVGAWLYYRVEPETFGQGKEKINQGYKGLEQKIKARIPGRTSKKSNPFNDWLAEGSLADRKQMLNGTASYPEKFTTWYEELPADTRATFNSDLADFCSAQGLSLEWLTDPKIQDDLRQSVEEMVTLYSLSYWKAVQLQDEAETFAAYQAWWADPLSSEQEDLTQRLFREAVARDYVSAPPVELVMAMDAERQKYVVGSLKDFAQENREQFYSLFQETLSAPAEKEEENSSEEAGEPAGEAKEEEAPAAEADVAVAKA